MNLGGLLMSIWLLHMVRAEGDPIPREMFEKITGGSVKSIADIKRLLQIESVDEEDDVYELNRNEARSWPRGNSSHSRVIRSVDVEQAQLAQCKTRTEVFEITRNLVDPTNANFVVQPSCVEVQRCSGCCNSRNMKCVPIRKHIRHVQVKKIVLHRTMKKIEHVPVALEDHVECKCEPINPVSVRSHHPVSEHRIIAVTATTPPPTTISRKEESQVRQFKRKNRKFKHLPSKKEQRHLLTT
ncbi:platelet-derived growth factor subunit B isoform X2 [Hyla sarda]|uniref:platelet-derived growth factor subunit B isoform X2 n=1 Tax=Hyla sarda TaxID=327740 RepID=UPI0024C36918|nr:platelet-derived growth factor subunit B isoform X2 [Hyla sarda]